MAGTIRISTDEVLSIASSIEGLNKRLKEILEDTQKTINQLDGTWDGEASQTTISGYDEFSTKFFQQYYEILDEYVKFLRINVASGYEQTETQNINLGDAFK